MKMPKKIEKNRYNIVLTKEQREIVEKIAEQENCSFSDVVGFAVIILGEKYEWKN